MSTATDNRFYREPHIQVVEKLSLRELFRLVEVTHETKDVIIDRPASGCHSEIPSCDHQHCY